MDAFSQRKPVLGVDVGGVILDYQAAQNTPYSFDGDSYLETPQVRGAFESLARLNVGRFKDSIYLISKIPAGSTRISEWLRHHKFFTKTGIPESHLMTCLERHEKEAIVAKLGVTHFVDDRAEVMSYMVGKVPHLYHFQGLDEDTEEFADARAHMTFVQSWEELLKHLQ